MLGSRRNRRKGSVLSERERGANPIADLLARQGVVILDGGLATELEARGHRLDDELWSARLIVDDPEAIRRMHLDYLEAGADCVTSASYQASLQGFRRRGMTEAAAIGMLRRAVELALEARDSFWGEPRNPPGRVRPLVAASVGPYGAFLADGSEYTGAYDLDEEGLFAFHHRRFEILAGAGADLLACETIPSLPEARALARLLEAFPTTWAWMSFSCRDGARISDGSDFAEVVAGLDPIPNLVAVGVNCTAPEHLAELIGRARAATNKPIVVYPNSGERWDAGARRWLPAAEPFVWTSAVRGWVRRGARLVGGCCRVGPASIASIRRSLLDPGERNQGP